jgi:hypothetical protein
MSGPNHSKPRKKFREGEAICLPPTAIIKTEFTDTRLTEDEISTFGCLGLGLGLVLLFHSSTTASSTLLPSIFLKKNSKSQKLSSSDLSLFFQQAANSNKKRVRVQTSNNKKRREECKHQTTRREEKSAICSQMKPSQLLESVLIPIGIVQGHDHTKNYKF